MKGQIIKDWNKVDPIKLFGGDFGEGKDIQHQRALQKALQMTKSEKLRFTEYAEENSWNHRFSSIMEHLQES